MVHRLQGGTVSDLPVNSSTTDVEKTEQATYEGTDEIIIYNGKEYHKSELCDSTLRWLELSENEQLLSSYMPPEFIEFEENWGITLTLDNVTPSGGIIKCTQSGGKATGKLQTGSSYIIEKWTQENGWQECDYYAEVEWTEEAWIIAKDTVSASKGNRPMLDHSIVYSSSSTSIRFAGSKVHKHGRDGKSRIKKYSVSKYINLVIGNTSK